jgi:hypothetical protein
MSDTPRPEFTRPIGPNGPVGRSPQRPIQRPRIPDETWGPAQTKARRLGRPIGHVITELLDQWLEEDQ